MEAMSSPMLAMSVSACLGATEQDMVAAGIAQVVGLGARRRRVSRRTSGVSRLVPAGSVFSRVAIAIEVVELEGSRSTSRIRPGVENTSEGRWVASVLRMISAAKELFSISPNRCRPSRRCR